MSTQIAYPHTEKPAGGVARLEAHPRLRVAQIVMDHLAHGWSAEEMLRQHPYLTPAEVHAALLYYFDHQDEIDAEIRAEWDEAQRDRAAAAPSPFVARLKAQGRL